MIEKSIENVAVESYNTGWWGGFMIGLPIGALIFSIVWGAKLYLASIGG